MHTVIRHICLNSEICLIELKAYDIAIASNPGQFVILRIDEKGERFPLTIYDSDKEKGTITLVCQAIGVSTKKFCALNAGDSVLDITGPLGHAVSTLKPGKVICIGGGVGTAEAYPIAKEMVGSGNDVTVIIGSRTKGLLICEKEIKEFCNKVYIATDDGTCGHKGFVTEILEVLLSKKTYDLVYAIGPINMMKAVADLTRENNIKTLVSLNSIMIDGTGMCGCCRVVVDNQQKFTCVDGPEFDAHLVNFDELIHRQSTYKKKEKTALDRYEKNCKIELDKD